MTTTNIRSEQTRLNGKVVDVTVTYLEQAAPPAVDAPKPARPVAIMRVKSPPIHFYRYLYLLVGEPWHWVSRRRMDDDRLRAIIHDANVFLYVLYVDGAPAGMAEVDARAGTHHELKFFGLAPDFVGLGLGRFFLIQVLHLIWARGPKKVLLETCTLDHPAALPLYQKLGFRVFDRRQTAVELMDPAPKPR